MSNQQQTVNRPRRTNPANRGKISASYPNRMCSSIPRAHDRVNARSVTRLTRHTRRTATPCKLIHRISPRRQATKHTLANSRNRTELKAAVEHHRPTNGEKNRIRRRRRGGGRGRGTIAAVRGDHHHHPILMKTRSRSKRYGPSFILGRTVACGSQGQAILIRS